MTPLSETSGLLSVIKYGDAAERSSWERRGSSTKPRLAIGCLATSSRSPCGGCGVGLNVALVDIGQFHVVACHPLHLFGQRGDLFAVDLLAQ